MTPQEQKQTEREQIERKETAEKIVERLPIVRAIFGIASALGFLALLGIFSAGLWQIFNWVTA
jgi:hypothetical protein